ncbi:AMP-binding protein [Desulfatibacillum aliphaticivorans]|uniref:AMP-binding protein n=1 Tax=Desulfatibacillum aliphaticivorans TaxID=218208 RepID=UPI0004174EDE|nr:AMP-binding protein [Desulfatibacillum aliphaticivorans]
MIYDSKPWLKSYDSGIAENLEIPQTPLKDYLVKSCFEYPDRAAANYMGTTMTYKDLLEKSGRLATALNQAGYGKGDVVAVCLPNTPQYMISIVGALRAGCAVSGLAPLLMPDEMAYQLNDCGAKALVILDMLFDAKLAPVADKVPNLQKVLVTGVFDPIPGTTDFPKGSPISGKQVSSFFEVINETPDNPPEVTLEMGDPCFLQYTGGTTGPPKGAVLTHGAMFSNVYQFEKWLHVNHGEEVWVSGFPMFHQAGLYVSVCCMAYGGTQCLIPDPRNTDHIIGEIEKYKPTLLVNVPSLYMMLMANEKFKDLDFSTVRGCMSGAAPFPVDAANQLEGIVGKNKMVEVWGMTETSPLITVNPVKNPAKIGSVGLPLPNTKFRIVDLADGWTEVPMGEEGELICSGPQVMQGYLNKPTETTNALREHEGDLWMHTGDVGRMDDDGFVYVVDRAKDMIIVGGFKVFSSEVEDKLYQHPAIEMCALVGLPNPERPDSEIVKLFVQKSAEYADTPDEKVQEEIAAFAKEKLAPYKVPKVYEFVEAIPLTSVGKVNKKILRV